MSTATQPSSVPQVPSLPASNGHERSGTPAAPRPPTGGLRRFLLRAGIAIAVLALIVFAINRWFWTSTAVAADVLATATRGQLPIVVLERGELESA
jgi:hypothetical protein